MLRARRAASGTPLLLLARDSKGGLGHSLNKLKPLRLTFAPRITDDLGIGPYM